MHRPNSLADDTQKNHRRRVEVKDRFDIGTSFIDRLVQGRLRHGFFEVDKKQFLAFDYSRTLARHEHHLIALVATQAEMSEGVAQSLPKNYPQRRDEIAFDGVVRFIGHIRSPFSPALQNRSIRRHGSRFARYELPNCEFSKP